MDSNTKLFFHVIIQAIEDLSYVGRDKELLYYRKQSLAWFKSNSADYKEVCLYAGVNPGSLRSKVLNMNAGNLKGLVHEYRSIID